MQYNTHTMIALIIPILAGAALGLVVNYLSDVLPDTRRLSKPACAACKAPMPLTDFLTGHKCRECGHARRARFWGVILALAAASAYIWLRPPAKIGFWPGLILLGYFATVFVIDMEHRLVLHPTSLFGAGLALILGWMSHGIVATLIGGLGGFLIMMALYAFGWVFTRLRARRMQAAGEASDDEEALGQGDVILATVLGLLVGWPLIWLSLLLGILFSGAFAILLMIRMIAARAYHKQAMMVFIPYGPFLILGAAMIVFLPQVLRAVLPG